jgi:hypothetical protein
MEEKNNKSKHGGARKGAGAPKKEASEQAKEILKKAIRTLYKTDTDEAAQILFIKDFAKTPRGQQFVAEHLFGKAPQVIEQEGTMTLQTPTLQFVSSDKSK